MTTETTVKDYWLCPDGQAHVWSYRGQETKTYQCQRCLMRVSKAQLQEATNA